MIEIKDYDLPITAAQKIVTGTKANKPSPLSKAIAVALTGDEDAGDTVDMFSLKEINEIAQYLLVYVESHKDGD